MKTLIILALSLFFWGCASKKPAESQQVEIDTVAPPLEKEDNDQPVIKTPQITEEELRAQQLEKDRLRLENLLNKLMNDDVYFEYDKADLTSDARDILTEVATILLKEQKFNVRIEGHTDDRGSDTYNLSLGAKRAETVKTYLTQYGVDNMRVTTVSFGEEKPKVEGDTEDARRYNRRASFNVQVK